MSECVQQSDKPSGLGGLSWNWTVALLAIFQLALGLTYLAEVPRLINDEAFESSLGHSLAFEGRIRTQVMTSCGGMDVHLVQNRLILPIVQSAIYRVMGFSITASRLGSVLMGMLAIVSICGIMRRWCGDKQSIWIGAVTILHPWFFEVSRRTRPEIYYMAFGMASLWCLTWLLERRTRRAGVLTGLVAGLTCLVHPSGCVLLLAIGVAMVLFQGDRGMWRLCPWLLLGWTVVIAPHVLYVLWSIQDPQVSFMGQMSACREVGIEQRWSGAPMNEVRRWARFVFWPHGAPLAAIFGAGVLGAFYRSNRADKTMGAVVVLFAILVAFALSANLSISPRYLTACLPFLCALTVRLVERVWRHDPLRRRPSLTRAAVSFGMAGAYAAICIGGTSLFFYRLHTADLNPTLQRIASSTGRSGWVYGRTLLWMGRDLYQYGPFYGYDPHLKERSVELVREAGFDYVVRSAWDFDSGFGVRRPPRAMPPFRDDPIDQLCQQYGVKLDEFHDPNFGPIEVYRLEWARDRLPSEDPPGANARDGPACPEAA